MSFRDWESEVEFYEELDGELVVRPERPFWRMPSSRFNLGIVEEAAVELLENSTPPFLELPFTRFDAQDSVVTYKSSREREVHMRIMGFATVNPIVFARIVSPGNKELLRKGELIGSQHPKEGILIPGVLRTHHLPVIREIGKTAGNSVLPTPLSQLHAHKPRG